MDDIRYRGLIQSANLGKIANNKPLNTPKNTPKPEKDFGSILKEKIDGVKFSKHAMQRLESRGVQVSNETMTKLNDAVENANKKGVSDLVAISDKSAFIINVTSKMVITTMNKAEMQNNIFTNINGAVII